MEPPPLYPPKMSEITPEAVENTLLNKINIVPVKRLPHEILKMEFKMLICI